MSHYTHDNSVGGPNVVHVSQVMGNVAAKQTGNQGAQGAALAIASWSTAPYVAHDRKRDSATAPKCAIEHCRAFAAKSWDGVCALHGRHGWRADGTKMTPEELAEWKRDRGFAE